MTPIFADTSYYLALANSSDQHHRAAYQYTKDFAGTFMTTAWVLTELANFLSHPANRSMFLSLLRDLRDDPRVTIVPPSEEVFERGLDLYARRSDKDWSLTDCISFVVMKQFGLITALTTDHHFEQAGFTSPLK